MIASRSSRSVVLQSRCMGCTGMVKYPKRIPAPCAAEARAAPKSLCNFVQQLPNRAAQDSRLVGLGKRQGAHLPHAIEGAHVEGVIAAEQHTRSADARHEKFERRAIVHDGV